MGHQVKRTVWLVGRLLLVAIAADLMRPVVSHAIPPVFESFLSLSDITTANSSTSKHGFLKKLDGNSAHCMGGDGNWNACSGGSGGSIESHTASASSSLDFTSCISSTYNKYEFEITDIVPASGTPVLDLEVSTNGGSTWDTTTNHYHVSHLVWSNSGSAVNGGLNTAIQIYPYTGRTMTTALPTSGYFRLFNPLGTSTKALFEGKMAGGDSVTAVATQTLDFTGDYEQLAAFNAVRFIMPSVNIASGTISCYGVPN